MLTPTAPRNGGKFNVFGRASEIHVLSAFEAFVNYNWPEVRKLHTSPWSLLDDKPCMMVLADGIGVMVVISKHYDLEDGVSDELLLEEIDYLIKADDWIVYGETWDDNVGAVLYDPHTGKSYSIQEMVENELAKKEAAEDEVEVEEKPKDHHFEEDAYHQDALDAEMEAVTEAWRNA